MSGVTVSRSFHPTNYEPVLPTHASAKENLTAVRAALVLEESRRVMEEGIHRNSKSSLLY
jgi:hypothetical protein